MIRRSIVCLRRAQITVPQLSPTHTRAKIVQWCVDTSPSTSSPLSVESYDPLFVLQCSPDLVTEGYRKHKDHEPLMIVETHDEGRLTLLDNIEMNQWYDVGTPIGEINDEDDDDDEFENNGEWLWQAYSHEEAEGEDQE